MINSDNIKEAAAVGANIVGSGALLTAADFHDRSPKFRDFLDKNLSPKNRELMNKLMAKPNIFGDLVVEKAEQGLKILSDNFNFQSIKEAMPWPLGPVAEQIKKLDFSTLSNALTWPLAPITEQIKKFVPNQNMLIALKELANDFVKDPVKITTDIVHKLCVKVPALNGTAIAIEDQRAREAALAKAST